LLRRRPKIKTSTTFILFLTAILTLAAGSAFGAYSGGSGEPNNPYQIADANDLLALAADTNDYGKCFILTADVNMQGQEFTTAIIAPDTSSSSGFQGTVFTGVFDGNGHKVIRFTINGDGNNSYLGLFGQVNSGGSVKNLGLENFAVSGYIGVGGLVGYNGGSISNCYSTGAASGNYYVGGLVGVSGGGSISNCYSTGAVSGGSSGHEVGGLVGCNFYGSISNCYSTGAVNGSSMVGGLVGFNGGSISNCYSTGSVSGTRDVGGIAGGNNGSISDCCSTGDITGSSVSISIGGLVGFNGGSISNCYSMGSVNGSSYVGGLVGGNDGSISGSYFLDIAGPNNGFGTPLTDGQMKQQSSFVGWDFNDVWHICEVINYPKLKWQILPGDIVCSDGVDFLDLAELCEQWLVEEIPADLAPPAGDGIVNFADFAVFAGQWGVSKDIYALNDFAKQWLKVGLRRCSADISPLPDGDGVVNMLDFAIFADNWLK
jgi:hypothetical protein